jgi:hypothetical protein
MFHDFLKIKFWEQFLIMPTLNICRTWDRYARVQIKSLPEFSSSCCQTQPAAGDPHAGQWTMQWESYALSTTTEQLSSTHLWLFLWPRAGQTATDFTREAGRQSGKKPSADYGSQLGDFEARIERTGALSKRGELTKACPLSSREGTVGKEPLGHLPCARPRTETCWVLAVEVVSNIFFVLLFEKDEDPIWLSLRSIRTQFRSQGKLLIHLGPFILKDLAC